MVGDGEQAVGLELGVTGQLVHPQGLGAGHVRGLELSERRVHRHFPGTRVETTEQGAHFPRVLVARREGREARIAIHGLAENAAGCEERRVVGGRDLRPAVTKPDQPVALREGLAFENAVALQEGRATTGVRPEECSHGVDHREPDFLAARAALAGEQCGTDGLRGGQRSHLVGEDLVVRGRLAGFGISLRMGDAGECLDHVVPGRFLCIGSFISETGHRDIDQLRSKFPQ